jgi:hypothetical protein
MIICDPVTVLLDLIDFASWPFDKTASSMLRPAANSVIGLNVEGLCMTLSFLHRRKHHGVQKQKGFALVTFEAGGLLRGH